ncbi:MAG: hypothetical protein JXR27_10485 [Paludibacteraceae bacterium]|nr:hypothetical protein [Paludibacteraceae bacterium]
MTTLKFRHYRCFYYTLLVFSILTLSSCSKRKSTNQHILQAETLLPGQPDSALILLSKPEISGKLSAPDKAALKLYKAYATFLSDTAQANRSIAYEALKYYDNSQLAYEKGLAHFLYGHILLDEEEVDEGMIHFKKAAKALINTNENNLIGLAYYYMGYSYALDAVYDKALHSMKIASIYFKNAEENINNAFALREIANAYDMGRYDTDSALVYFNKSKNVLLQEGDTAGFFDVQFYRAITLLNRTDRFEEAKNDILEVYRYYKNDSYYHNKLSYAYARMGYADSAMFYYQASKQDTTNIYSKMAINMAGAYTYSAMGKYKEALEAYTQYDLNKTEIFNEQRKSQLYRIDKGFDISEKEKENTELRVQQRNMIIQISIMIILVLVLVIAFMFQVLRRNRERLQHTKEKQKLLEKMEQKRVILLTKIRGRINSALQLNKMETKYRHGGTDAKELLNEILLQAVLSESNWEEYIHEIDLISNYHISELTTTHPTLTNADKIVIALSSLGIDITDSCTLLGMNKNTMYRRRNTIKERLGLDKTVDFEKWIHERIPGSSQKVGEKAIKY